MEDELSRWEDESPALQAANQEEDDREPCPHCDSAHCQFSAEYPFCSIMS